MRNFRALREVEFKDLTPLTVLLGPNGSGKSTVFDVFAFLAECFELGLRRAWDKRGRARELRTRGSEGPVTIEIGCQPGFPRITYHLAVDERGGGPVVVEESAPWKRGQSRSAIPFSRLSRWQGQDHQRRTARRARHTHRCAAQIRRPSGRECPGPVRRPPQGCGLARLHHWLDVLYLKNMDV